MSSGLILNHISASGNHTETINSVSQGVMYVSGAAAFGVPSTVGGETSFSWPGTDVNFFVSGSTSTGATTAVFGGNVHVSGALSAGSITGGLSADGTPVAQQVAIWTGASTIKGDSNLYWDDSDLVVNGNLQVQGSTTTISSSNFVVKDSIIGIGFSGSDSFDNSGDRGIVFGRGASAGSRLPAIFLDGTNNRFIYASTPTSPASGSFNKTLGDGTSADHHIRVAHTASATTDLLDVHMGKFVSPVAQGGTVEYPSISGSIVNTQGSTYNSVLQTTRLKVGSNAYIGFGSDEALRIDGAAKATWRDSGVYVNSPADGVLRLSTDGSLQLSASSGHVGVKSNSVRPDADNVSSLGVSGASWSDLFLGSGAVINFNAGNVTLTHGTDKLTLKGHWVPDADSTYDLGDTSNAWDTVYADSVDLNGVGALILDENGDTKISATTDDIIKFFVGNGSTSKFEMDTEAFYPTTDNSYDIGSAALRFRNIYTGDLNLQNDRGDWTLIEEQDFLSFRNNKSGRRYRMIMEDITGMGNYGPGNDGEM